jgi:hypothetical protein
VGEDGEDGGTQQPRRRGGRAAALDRDARLLDQPVVLDAGGARGHARHAAQAAVEVLAHGVVQLDPPLLERRHQVDAPARGVHLLVPERVGRATRQAEAAVDAVGDQLGVDADARIAGSRRGQIALHIASTTRSASGLHLAGAATAL